MEYFGRILMTHNLFKRFKITFLHNLKKILELFRLKDHEYVDIHAGTVLKIQDHYSFYNPEGEPILKSNMNILIFLYKFTNYISIYFNNSKELDSLPEAKSKDFVQYCK